MTLHSLSHRAASTLAFLLGVAALGSGGLTQVKLEFPRAFAPSDGLTVDAEKPLRDEVCLNGSWEFQPVPRPRAFRPNAGKPPALPEPSADKWSSTKIRIPSPWNVNAFPYGPSQPNRLGPGGDFRAYPSYPPEWDKADMGWLRRSFTVPPAWVGKRLILHFEAVAGAADVRVNGKKVGEHFDLFMPFDVDVTDAVKPGGADNELLVGVRKGELFSNAGPLGKRPFVAGSMWGETIVGIWQDVYLHAVPTVRTTETLVQPLVDADSLQADVTLHNDTAEPQDVEVGATIQPWVNLAGTDTLTAPEPKWRLDPPVMDLPPQRVTIAPGQSADVSLTGAVKGRLKLWSPDAPNLYGLTVSVSRAGQPVDKKYTRFGYRQWKLGSTKLQLNGKDIDINGDAWHFLGVPQMTRRYAWAWYTAVKAANGNCVRLHAQPYPRLYAEVADEMGMLVLDETAVWGSGGTAKLDDPEYWSAADRQVESLVMRDRNHPSVMGYSVANEILVIVRINHGSQAVTDNVLAHYAKWAKDIARLDPTRPWVSGDGEEEAGGTLPTVIGHYGGTDGPKRWSKAGRPWGVGECGMAYYGTPKQVSEFNGPAAYTSMNARLEGCAIQAYELITRTHRDLGAAYSSVFNTVWYGLQPLEIGLKDTSRPPAIGDGVWFGAFVEGRPGAQPERLGPYCTTLNPGYDPALPLYRTWPMFDAIRAANAPGTPAPSPWDHRPTATTLPAVAESNAATRPAFDSVAVLTSGRESLTLELGLLGVPVTREPAPASPTGLLVIDGSAPPPASSKASIDQLLSAGGTVLVWQPRRAALPALNALLPAPLELTDRVASSLVRASGDPVTSGVSNADLYFAELKPDVILDGGLAGPIAARGKVLLQAPAVDWRAWNNQPEVIKTGSVTRSEREAKPGGAGLVVVPVGTGRIVLANLANLSVTPDRVETARKLLANLGVRLSPPRDLIGGGIFTNAGTLRRALFVGPFAPRDGSPQASADHPDLSGPAFDAPTDGTSVGDRKWTVGTAEPANQLFHIGGPHVDLRGATPHATAYASFWIHSPRDLADVLSQPDVPHLDLFIHGNGAAAAAWLNGAPLKTDGPAATDARARQAFPALVLRRGWNHVVVKLSRGDGNWEFGASLRCSDPTFLSTIEAALEEPQH
jgi:beta-galactosidase